MKKSSVVLVCCLVAGCANTIKPGGLPQMRISQVNVTVAPGLSENSDVKSQVKASTERMAGVYNKYMPANTPTRALNVQVTSIRYKNAVASLLIGSTNSISGVVATGSGPASKVAFVDPRGAAVNGVIGAAIAIGADKSRVDRRLAAGFAQDAVAKAYGQERAPQFVLDDLNGRPSQPLPTPGRAEALAAQPAS